MFRRLERLFHRYQQTGEPRLLGVVFDRTAPELLRVALHLTRDRHRAEDVLQNTFLIAIEKVLRLGHPRDMTPGGDNLAPDEVDGVYRAANLDPGPYVLRLFGPDCAPQNLPIALAAGERRELDLTAERAVPICIEIQLHPEPSRGNGLADGVLSVTNAAGERVVFHRLWGYFDDAEQHLVRLRMGLAPGTYRVHADDLAGKQKDLQIEVPEAAPAKPFAIDVR